MDINLKNSKFKIIVNAIIFTIITIMSFLIVSFYPNLSSLQEKHKLSKYPTVSLRQDIDYYNYILYKDMLKKEKGDNFDFSEYISTSFGNNIDIDKIADKFDNDLEDRKIAFNAKYKNLEYCIQNDKGTKLTNSKSDFDVLLNNQDLYNKDSMDTLLKDYEYILKISYGSTDTPNDIHVYPYYSDEDTKAYQRNNYYYENTFKEYVKLNLPNAYKDAKHDIIGNTTIIYAIPKDLQYTDSISEANDEETYNYNDSLYGAVIVVLLVIAILSLFIPYFISKKIFSSNFLIKRSIEFNIIFSIFAAIGAGSLVLGSIYSSTTEDIVNFLTEKFVSYTAANNIVYFGSVIIWIIAIYIVISIMTLIKHIFKVGIGKYIKEKSILISILRHIKRNILSLINKIDLSKDANRLILKIVVINFLVVAFLCVTWFFGFIGAIIYSCVLFNIMHKYYDDIKEKYNKLLKVTSRISEGDIDVSIDENLGVFEPVKVEIQKIQKGFKKAVDEEVKSERMRSELVSNVSHDLKTPLTSIITYIDLLKDPNITEEDRAKYIETLDNKSNRLKVLIENLFEVSKFNSGNIVLDCAEVDIVSLIKQTLIETSDKLNTKSIVVKQNLPEDKIYLNLDGEKTYRVFENLLVNISKYAMPSSRAYIDVIEDEEKVSITIRNISESEMNFNGEDIIERFARGDKSRNTEGSGLGLSIAKSIVELENGTFKIDIDGDLFKVNIIFKK